jgi:hypothetical protein
VSALVSAGFAALMIGLGRRTRLEVDRATGVLPIVAPRLGPSVPEEITLSSVDQAETESIDDSAFYSLVLVRGDARTIVAQGRERMVRAAAAEVNLEVERRGRPRREARGTSRRPRGAPRGGPDAPAALAPGAPTRVVGLDNLGVP